MKILINTASTYQGGGVQVARSFIEECRNLNEHEYHVILGEMVSNLISPSDYPANFSFYKIGYRPATRVFSLKPHSSDFKTIEDKVKPDVVFTTSGPAYWRPNAPHLVGYNRAHYIYKDSPFFSQISLKERIKWDLEGRILKFFFVREADAFVVQTDDINRRLRNWLQKKKIYTISNTFSMHYEDPKKSANKLPDKKTDEYRFLSISAWHTHKNLGIITDVIEALPRDYKNRIRFVLTLPQEKFNGNFSTGERKHIINVGPVKPEEGPSLYCECDALFLPTLLECFSASYAEAMKMKKPILTSDLEFAHSVCGDAALYFDPVDPVAISEKIIELIENPALQEKLIQNGIRRQCAFLTARERAEEYLKICRELADAAKN
jgi:glycosyltransferase involved in cell wall biosynthesis